MKKYFLNFLLFLLFLNGYLFAEIRIKTIEFNFGGYYSSTNLASNTQFNFPTRFIRLPENSKIIRTAWLEYYGLAVSAVNVNPIVIYFDPGNTASTARFTSAQYTAQSGESIVLSAKADVTSVIASQLSNLTQGLNFTAGIRITGPTSNMHTMKLYITYEYDDASPNQIKTVKFPLYSDWNSKIASFNNPQSNTTVSMSYFADLPDLKQIYQQWFEITAFKRYINTTAGTIRVSGDGTNYEPTMYIDSSLADSFYFRYLSSSNFVSGFSTGSVKTLAINITNDAFHFLGGEVVITYEFVTTATYKVTTISQFLGQSSVGTSQSVLISTINFNEEDVIPLEVYSKIYGSNDATASTTFNIASSLGGISLSNVVYNIYYSNALISDWSFIYSYNSALNGFSKGAILVSTISANTTAGGYGGELFITYKYKNDAAHITNYGIYSGNNTSGATSYSYTGVPVFWVETGSSKTLVSAYTIADFVATNFNGDQQTAIAYNYNSTHTITHRTINESSTMFQLYQNISQVPVGASSFTVSYQNVSGVSSIFTGKSYLTYLYTPPPKLPSNLSQKRNDTNFDIPISSWINTNSVSFYSSLSSSKTYDNLALVVEFKLATAPFDGLNLSTSAFSSFNANISSYVNVGLSRSGISEGQYKWRARTLGDGGVSGWVEFSTYAFGVDLTSPPAPPMLSITPIDKSSFNYSLVNFSFEQVNDNLSGVRNYELQVSTSQSFTPVTFSTISASTSITTNISEGFYFWRTRVYDRAGNIGVWSSTRSFIVDLTSPTIKNNLVNKEDEWRSVNNGYYDIDLEDNLAYLSRFQIKITTSTNESGTIIVDWSDIESNINRNLYDLDWQIPNNIFELIPSGTSYVSIRVYDNAGNYSKEIDSFYIRKDTVPPQTPSLISPINYSSTNITNILFSWTTSSDMYSGVSGYLLEISTINNFSVIFSSAFVISNSTSIVLNNSSKYFWRVRARDVAGNYSGYSSIYSVIVDTIQPRVFDNQIGDEIWRSSNVAYYDIDFDDLLSGLNKFQIKITTGTNQTGFLIVDWYDLVSNINAFSYTQNWQIPNTVFDLIPSGTCYVSVKVYDNAGNYSQAVDVFYVRKDTVPPTTPTLLSPLNYSTTNITNIDFSWLSSDDIHSGVYGYEIEISTKSDFSVIYSSIFVTNTNTQITLNNSDRYFWRVRARDNAYNYSTYSSVFSVLVDTIPPKIIDNQNGDDFERLINNGTYNVSFEDEGGSLISKFQIKATTAPNQSGTLVFDWSDVYTNINSSTYPGGWSIRDFQFNLLFYTTNYISIRVWDNAGNYVELVDAFYIIKIPNIPKIKDYQDGDDVWISSNSRYYNVDFETPLGYLTKFEVRASTPNSQWFLVLDNINQPVYTTDWQLPVEFFDMLPNGTNYISVRVWNSSNNYSTADDVFYVLKDTIPPHSQIQTPLYVNSLSFYVSYNASDSLSGIDYVELYYTYETSQPYNWIKFGSFTSSPILFTSTVSTTVGFKIIAYDRAGNKEEALPNSYTLPESTTSIDLTTPIIVDNQMGDDIWRNSGGIFYDVDFFASGLSPLATAYYLVKDGFGNIVVGWEKIAFINSSSYTSNWQVDFDKLVSSFNYVSVKVSNLAGNESVLSNVFYIKKDTQVPTISDNQLGDDIWRGVNDGVYDIDFYDVGPSGLNKFQIRVTTGLNGSGQVISDWIDVVTNINQSSYSMNWQIPTNVFNAMVNGTNYVSVRVYDNAGNFSVMNDVFYVKKDTQAPTISDNQLGDDVWISSNSRVYSVFFNDNHSGLSEFQIKASTSQGLAGGILFDWTDVFSDIYSSSYNTPWDLPVNLWNLLVNGTNYISVRVFDIAGNVSVSTDVFYVLKDTVPANSISNLDGLTADEGSVIITFTSPFDSDGSCVLGYIVKYATYVITESNFDSVSTYNQSWLPAPCGSLETRSIVGLQPNTYYYFAIKSIDKAGNISNISNVKQILTGQDTTPPAAISDLKAYPGPYKGSIVIEFTATGDNGNIGTASGYRVRWRTDVPITSLSLWNSATEYIQNWVPQEAGNQESFILMGLQQGVTYYLAVRVFDEVFNISALSNSTHTYASSYPARDGLIVYQNGTGNVALSSIYLSTAASFQTPLSMPPTDAGSGSTIRHVIVRASPLRKEMMAGILSSDGVLQIMRYDYNSNQWSKQWSTTTITATNSAYRGFDIAYENLSGRCLVLYNGATAGTLFYNIYDGTSWTGALTLTTGTAQTVAWVRLEPRPNSNEIMAVFSKITSLELYATKWTGNSWTDGFQLRNGVGVITMQDFDFAWNNTGTKALFVFGAGNTGYAQTRIYSNGVWSVGPNFTLQGNNGTIRYIVVKGDPNSKYIGVTSFDTGADWNANIFDSDSDQFISQAQEHTNIRNTANQNNPIAAVWDNSSRFIVAAAHATSFGIHWASWTVHSGWGVSLLNAPTFTGWNNTINGVKLERDKELNHIYLYANSSSNDLRAAVFTGNGWSFISPNPLSTNVTATTYQPYFFATTLHDIIPPIIIDNQSGDDVWRSSNVAFYNIDANDDGGSGLRFIETLIYSGPNKTGNLILNWTSQVSTSQVNSYYTDWKLSDTTFNLLREGVNYVTVRAVDGSGNISQEVVDAFYVKKDTTSPTVPSLIYPLNNSSINVLNVNFNWSNSIDYASGVLGYEILVSTDENFNTVLFSSSVSFNSITLSFPKEGRYFWKVRAYDLVYNYSQYSLHYSVFIDTTPPTISDLQEGDDLWINSNSRSYSIYFADLGGSLLSKFQIRVTTSPSSTTPIFNWNDVVSNINLSSYNTPWNIPLNLWNLLPNGTSYISVRVYDNAGNISEMMNVFYVKKDVLLPQIIDNQDGDNIWRNTNSAFYNVDFYDYGGSLLDKIQIKATTLPNGAGELVFDWQDFKIALNTQSYEENFVIPNHFWNQLKSGSNYISFRVFDNAGNISVSTDVFYILKDTTPPSTFDLISPANNSYSSTTLINFSWYSSTDDLSQINFYEVIISTDNNFNFVYSSFTTPYTNAISNLPTGLYFWKVRALDKANNYSSWSLVFNIFVDTIPPQIFDNQLGDDIWRSSNTGSYDVDFFDSGGSKLDKVQIKATSGQLQSGSVFFDWTDVIGGIYQDSYTSNFVITNDMFNLLPNGTSYISVRVYDRAGNVSVASDVFYIRKDNLSPLIYDNQEGDDIWRSENIGFYNIDFFDSYSLLNRFEIKITTGPNQTGSVVSDWITIMSAINRNLYVDNWKIPDSLFNLLPTGRNYVSVRVYDNAGNVSVSTDVFYIQKDTMPVNIINNENVSHYAVWLNTNSLLYDVDFFAYGSSYLDRVEIAISTRGYNIQPYFIDWTEILSNINSNVYTDDWKLPDYIFDLLLSGVTNYVSVRVFNQAGSRTTLSDAFYILKDTITPTYVKNIADEYKWTNSSSTLYDVDLFDNESGVYKFEILASTNQNGDYPISGWNQVFSNINSKSFTNNWALTHDIFSLLHEGTTNYISIKVHDIASNIATYYDVFKVFKDTTPPQIIDNEGGDNIWRNNESGFYDIDFNDSGGSKLNKFSVRVSTSPSGTSYYTSWIDVISNISDNSYSLNWQIPHYIWDLIVEGTSYVYIKAEDFAGNFSNTPTYAFIVKKDTTPPNIPTLISPSSNSFINSLNDINFSWEQSFDMLSGTTYYELVISSYSDFSYIYLSTISYQTSKFLALPHQGRWWWRVKAVDNAGNNSLYSNSFSLFIDTTPPYIIDNQTGDDVWISSNVRYYDVDFEDYDSGLFKFQIKAVNNNQIVFDWTDVFSLNNVNQYSSNWTIPDNLFNLLTNGVNNISVRVYDRALNITQTDDVFYIKKDTTPPKVIDNQVGDDIWRKESVGDIYDVDFEDYDSYLSSAAYYVYSQTNRGGIFISSGLIFGPLYNNSTYINNWNVNFDLLREGINYVSVSVWDNALNIKNQNDVFYIKKDTTPPIIEDLQLGDTNFYNVNPGNIFDVRFYDYGIGISTISIKAATLPNQNGEILINGATIYSGTYINQYTSKWGVDDYLWSLLRHGTNYISVYAYDGLGQVSVSTDVFYIQKDTVPPSVISNLNAYNQIVPSDEGSVYLNWTAPGDDGEIGSVRNYEIRFATYIITFENFENANVYLSTLIPKSYGSLELLKVENLVPSLTYYFAIKSVDKAGNKSSISNTTSTYSTPDLTPPLPINDLLANPGDFTGQIKLQWTSRGEGTKGVEGNYPAVGYIIKYATYVINSGNFNLATTYSNSITPKNPGQVEEFILEGLEPETTYYIAIKSYDEAGNVSDISNVVFTYASPKGPRDGIILYSKAGSQTLKYRKYSNAQWSSELDSGIYFSGTVRWIVLKSIPVIRDEMIAAVLDSNNVLKVLRYDGVSDSWSDITPTPLPNPGSSLYRNFDLTIEQNSARVMFVYYNNTAGSISYAVWSSTSSSWVIQPTSLAMASLTGQIYWVRLKSLQNSNRIAVAVLDSNSDISAAIWNGSSWQNNVNLTVSASIATEESFDIAWESQSGDLLALWGTGTTTNYRKWYSTGSWGSTLTGPNIAATAGANWIRLCSSPLSNRIGFTSIDGDGDWNVAIWRPSGGEGWSALPTEDAAMSAHDKRITDCTWQSKSERFVAVAVDDLGTVDNQFDWIVWENGAWNPASPSVSVANTNTTFSNNIKWISLIGDPDTDLITFTGVDQSNNLRTTVWNGSLWAGSGSGPNFFHGVIHDFNYEGFAFEYRRKDNIPPTIIDNQQGDSVWRNSNIATYSVFVNDTGGSLIKDIQTKVYTGPNGSGILVENWTTQLANINSSSYSTPWKLTDATFNKLIQGVTNYIWVRAIDNAGNVSIEMQDVFYVRKDTTPPTIISYLSTSSFNFWTSTGVGLINIDFLDSGGSQLSLATYSVWTSTGNSGNLVVSNVLISSNINSNSYNTDWNINFSLLANGTNYITVTVWDNAGSFSSLVDAFKVLKDTIPPSQVNNLVAQPGPTLGTVMLSFSSPYDDLTYGNNTQGGYIIKYATFAIIDENTFNLASSYIYDNFPKNAGETENIVVYDLNPQLTYYFAIKAYDKANNLSLRSNTSNTIPQRSNVFINEVYPSGNTGFDWIELYNNTNQSFNLAGWKLVYHQGPVDGEGVDVDVWVGTSTDIINPGQVKKINISFNLNSAQSYSIILRNQFGKIVDKVQWPILSIGESFSRIYDGDRFFEIDKTPTGGYKNSISTSPLKINEVSYKDGEFIEIYNNSNYLVSFTNYYIRNSIGLFRFTKNIHPYSYTLIDESSFDIEGNNWYDVFLGGLNEDYDYIVLENDIGQTLDRVSWGKVYTSTGGLTSNYSYAPSSTISSIIRSHDSFDSDNDSSDFSISYIKTPLAKNNSLVSTANLILYPYSNSYIPTKSIFRIKLSQDYSSGYNDLIVFVNTDRKDLNSPHIFRLSDLGFNLSLTSTQTILVDLDGIEDIDNKKLVDKASYRIILITDKSDSSFISYVSSVTVDKSTHIVNSTFTLNSWFEEEKYIDIFRIDIYNPSNYSVYLTSVSLTFMTTYYQLLSQELVNKLISNILIYKDSSYGNRGLFEIGIDYEDLVMLSNLEINSGKVNISIEPTSSSLIQPKSTATYFVVFVASKDASLQSTSTIVVTLQNQDIYVSDEYSLVRQNLKSLISELIVSTIVFIKPNIVEGWVYDTGAISNVEKLIGFGDNNIYIGLRDGKIKVLDYIDGSLRWEFVTNPLSPIVTSPLWSSDDNGNEYIYFACSNGDIYKLKDNGNNYLQIWKKNINAQITTDLFDISGKIYFGTSNQKIYCIDKQNGDVCDGWVFDNAIDSNPSSPFSLDDREDMNLGWVGLESGKVIAFRLNDGVVINQFMATGKVNAAPFVDSAYSSASNNIYIVSNDGKLYSRVASNLNVIPPDWNDVSLNNSVRSSPFKVPYQNYIIVGDEGGVLYKINSITGVTENIFRTNFPIRTMPVVWAGVVYFASGKYIYALDLTTFQLKNGWPIYIGSEIKGDIVFDNSYGNILFSNNEGKSFRIGLW